jgi:excinuclease ABC subunit A
MEEILNRDRNPNVLRFAESVVCHHCNGSRLNHKALSYKWKDKTISDFASMSIDELHDFFAASAEFDSAEKEIADTIIRRTTNLKDLGVGHLELTRESSSLSSGEYQRIRLANQASVGLRNILYILDEPGAGLHPSEQEKLLRVLRELVNSGNTVIMTGHAESNIIKADHIIDIGPGPASSGGEIIFNGGVKDFLNNPPTTSITAKYLFQTHRIKQNKNDLREDIFIRNANTNNLKNLDIKLCSSAFNVITGVSGAGKSSLIKHFTTVLNSKEIESAKQFSKVIHIDQTPIGRSPKSNPATYTGLSDYIRDLMASLPESKKLGLTKSHFSFVVKGGRCEDCSGAGYIQTGMHFLGNVEVVCEKCNGKRFSDYTLQAEYKGKNIYEILELTVDEANEHFSGQTKICNYLQWLKNLGLGYLKLGQSSTTLSGGEAQRVKLATELVKTAGKNCLYILDEPTTGLHAADTEVIIKALNNLCDKAHTILCTSHDPRFILNSDYIVDLGPGSGRSGGNLIYNGAMPEFLDFKESSTAAALRSFVSGLERIKLDVLEVELISKESLVYFKGIKTNNLKNINYSFEPEKITAVCGVSGSGKSSLIFDTVYAECKRRQLDGMSSYMRQFIGKEGNSQFDFANGLMPAIALKKKSAGHNPRSTIGTYTGLYDLYRLFYSRFSHNGNEKCKLLSTAFSFNHEDGACPICKGLGFITVADSHKFITNPEKSLLSGALNGTKTGKFYTDPDDRFIATLLAVGKIKNIDFSIPWNDLNDEAKEIAIHGCGNTIFDVEWNYKRGQIEGVHKMKSVWIGFAGLINDEYDRKHADNRGEAMLAIMKNEKCENCNSHRIKPEYLKYKVNDINIGELSALSASEAITWLDSLKLDESATTIINEIKQILNSLKKSGISYLSANRITSTLSGGEFQRLQLAGLLKSPMTGIIYVLDEPSFGLSSSDSIKIAEIITDLKDNGNTILLNDHSPEILKIADTITVMGYGAGKNGGEIIKTCSSKEYIADLVQIKADKLYSVSTSIPALKVFNAYANNLKNISVEFPAQSFSVITGNSGSGKTSLLEYVVNASLDTKSPVLCKNIEVHNSYQQHVFTGQEILSASSISIPATRLDLFDYIRNLFAQSEQSRKAGFKATHFSFHNAQGQCPDCKGTGIYKISMDFWSDSEQICESCNGSRYKDIILDVKLNGLNIAEVLELSFDDFGEWLNGFPPKSITDKIRQTVYLCSDAGIGYLSLGQTLNTLSAGELQRLKLVAGLSQIKDTSIILMDEPTGGLHPSDTKKLLILFDKLLREGHTIICASHDEMIISAASKVICLDD